MKKYISIARCSMHNSLAYRSSFLLTMISNVFSFLALLYLWSTVYRYRTAFGSYTWEDMKAYLFITLVINSLLSWYSEMNISRKIRDGSVAMDLLRPVHFQQASLAETLGISVFEGGLAAIILTVGLVLFAGMQPPQTITGGALFLISLLASILIKFGVIYLASLCTFWTSSAFGIARARLAITSLLSGALVPLPLLPEPIEQIALVLPFQGIVHTPVSIYLGHADTAAALKLVGIQIVWSVVLWYLGKRVWRRAIRQVTIYGG